ncbi:hypothetical protein F4802DRAFT_602401 [Xylaria palmicola]|nr:hypothetical protein F4802DRAFT_602401 [Xylaria palmicola]
MKFSLVTFAAALAGLTLAADPAGDVNIDAPFIETIITTLTRRPPPPPPTRTSTSSSVITTVTTLPTTLPPGKPTVIPRPCPTVTLTTRPSGCQPIRCPIPGCTYEEDMIVPCGCQPRTLLWVEGCQTACPEGCATRTNTLSQLCAATATAEPFAAV